MTTTTSDLTWLLEQFLTDAPAAQAVVVSSVDGLVISHSNIENADSGSADTLAAVSSSHHSLMKSAAGALHLSGQVSNIAQIGSSALVILAAGPGAMLTVLGKPDADAGQLIYDANLLAGQVPQWLTVPKRSEPDTTGQVHR